MRLALVFVCLIAVSAVPAHGDHGFEGHWKGQIEVPGMALEIYVHLSRDTTGAWTGTIDIPMQGAKDLALAGIAVAGDSIVFAIAGVPGNPTFNGTLEGERVSGPFTQGGQSFPFELARGEAARPLRPQDPQPPFPYSSEDAAFMNGDVTLAGTLTLPESDGPFPAVVLLSGSGAQNRDEELFDHRPFLVIADHLARAGIAALRYDDRGVGGSSGSTSGSTTEDFARDALAAVAFLGTRDEIDRGAIGLVGHSEGATTAPLAASQSSDVAFIVLLAAPGVSIPDLLAVQTERLIRAGGASDSLVAAHIAINRLLTASATSDASDPEIRAELRALIERQIALAPGTSDLDEDALEPIVEANIERVLTPWFQYFLRYDPVAVLERVTVPVLALFGDLDLQVDAAQNRPGVEAALRRAGNEDVTAHTFVGLNHLFQHAMTGTVEEYGQIDETVSPEVLEMIAAWIHTRFAGD